MSKQSTDEPIRLIVGLGNPGAKYEQTRHNAGFWFVDLLARQYNAAFKVESKFHGMAARIVVGGEDCWLLKPNTFMNRSGQSVSSLAKYYKISLAQMLVAHDELDMPPGVVRLKQGGGHAGHNGLRDIMSAMGGRDFWRYRIGIDHPGSSKDVADYVLTRPSKDDAVRIEGAIDEAASQLPLLVEGAFSKVMNRLHTSR
ncbi:MAG: aminoacyl-tRNA hydrolase [Chromatiales bacterium]|nr:aminoacyl-tRNA hydrolase [Chromatiales bacterium]